MTKVKLLLVCFIILIGMQLNASSCVKIEWQIIWIDSSEPYVSGEGYVMFDAACTPETCQVDIPRPSNGHFNVRVRVCEENACGDWAEVMDPLKRLKGLEL